MLSQLYHIYWHACGKVLKQTDDSASKSFMSLSLTLHWLLVHMLHDLRSCWYLACFELMNLFCLRSSNVKRAFSC